MQCGNEYLQINCVKSTVNVGGFHVDFEFRSKLPLEKQVVGLIVNSSWKLCIKDLYDDIEKYTSKIISSILKPLLSKLPIQDFFYDLCERGCGC